MKTLAQATLTLAIFCSGSFIDRSAAAKEPKVRVTVGDTEAVFCLIEPKADRVDYPDFYMLETEVTNKQYQQFLKDTKRKKDDTEVVEIVEKRRASMTFSTGDVPYSVEDPTAIWKDGQYPKGHDEFPVCLVTLEDATDFCKWLTDKNRNLGVFRLPTWNEWMVAAYGRERKYPWGDKWDKSLVHMSYGFKDPDFPKRTEAVKARPKGRTPQGLYGMLGNASELIDEADPTNENYLNLGARWMGGGFTHGYSFRSEDNGPLEPRQDYWGYSHHSTLRECDLGFRVVLDPSKDPSLLKRPRLFSQVNKNWMIEDK